MRFSFSFEEEEEDEPIIIRRILKPGEKCLLEHPRYMIKCCNKKGSFAIWAVKGRGVEIENSGPGNVIIWDKELIEE